MNTNDNKRTVISVRTPLRTSTRLSELAKSTNRTRSALVEEALEQYVAHQNWLSGEIKRGLAAANNGSLIENHSVAAWITALETNA
jgi:predicted transcriptional regulator